MFPTRMPSGKVVLYACATGERLERWPVDARDMIASGAYQAHDPAQPPLADPTPDPAPLLPGDPGMPLIVTRSTDAAPARPVTILTGSRKAKK